ncbi:MAG: hypothetical protein PVI19_00065 [Syntrophobacterales bacterium]
MKRSLSTMQRSILLLCLLLSVFSFPALAQEMGPARPLVASGTTSMLEQDSPEARKLALDEALRAAVEEALGWLIPSERIVRFYPLLLNRVLTEPMEYVQDYQIIHEGVIFGLYRVSVQTTLYLDRLKQDLRRLGLLLSSSERPQVAILVAERTDPENSWHWWWQMPPAGHRQLVFSQALAQLISARALVPLDSNLLMENFPEDPIYQEPMLRDVQGAALARALGAQVAVLGQVSHQPASDGAPAISNGSLRAVRADSGEILARVSASVQVQPSSEDPVTDYGFSALAERLAPHLVDGILAPFVVVSRTPSEATVQVIGVQSYGDLILIKEYLQSAPGVKEISQIQLSGDLGSFGLILAGDLRDLSNALSGYDFGSFSTSAELAGDNLVTVRIHRKR